jgi:hypothetical protein
MAGLLRYAAAGVAGQGGDVGLEDDLDAMVREADALCEQRAWDSLLDLRSRCLAAVERGHQHWPIASLVEYRLALLAPAELAVAQLEEGRGRFAVGPLTELVASDRSWETLEGHLAPGPPAAVVAHERVVRGDDVDAEWLATHVEVPSVLQPWEPAYAVPTYTWNAVESPRPEVVVGAYAGDAAGVMRASSDESAREAAAALRDVAAAWQRVAGARVHVVAADGDAATATCSVGLSGAALHVAKPAEVLAVLAWCGSLSGAVGPRRGCAAGRAAAWWAAASLGGLEEEWPVHPDDLGEVLDDLRWYWIRPQRPMSGWELAVAVEDPDNRLAWALHVDGSSALAASGPQPAQISE